MTILVTGVAGFIGFHVARALLARGEQVVGIDNINSYYDIRLKHARLAQLDGQAGFTFHHGDIADRQFMEGLGTAYPELAGIIHLAAQAGVRYSQTHPYEYAAANLVGHLCVLELARSLRHCAHVVYASSSSVYGADATVPFKETDRVDAPMSLYAATKRADELMSHAYALQYGIPLTGLRFFTVYGPWGRPDMAYFSFAQAISEGRPITLFDGGRLKRDFTYIDDIVAGVLASFALPPNDRPPVRLLNIGNHDTRAVSELVALLEAGLGKTALIVDQERPASDVMETYADVSALSELTGIFPTTKFQDGIRLFIKWFTEWERASRAS